MLPEHDSVLDSQVGDAHRNLPRLFALGRASGRVFFIFYPWG